MMAYTLAWSKRPKSHLKVFKPIWYWFNKKDIQSMFKIQWVRDDAFDDTFLEAEARKTEEVLRPDFFS